MRKIEDIDSGILDNYITKGLEGGVEYDGNFFEFGFFKSKGFCIVINNEKFKVENVSREDKIALVKNLGLKEKYERKKEEERKFREKCLEKVKEQLENIEFDLKEVTVRTKDYEVRKTYGPGGSYQGAVAIPVNEVTKKGHKSKEGFHGWIEKILYDLDLADVEMMNVTLCEENELNRRIMDLAHTLQKKYEKKVEVKVYKEEIDFGQFAQERYVPRSLDI